MFFMFRRYMADLYEYMVCAVCVGDLIIPQQLWAYNLISLPERRIGLQQEMKGLQRFSENNVMMVNNLMTTAMLFEVTRN